MLVPILKVKLQDTIFQLCVWLKRRALLRFSESLKPKQLGNSIVLSKIDENRCKQWQVYLDFGRAGSLSLQLY